MAKDDGSELFIVLGLIATTGFFLMAFSPADDNTGDTTTTDNTTTMTTLAYLNKYSGTDKDAFANSVTTVANALGISANDLMFVMNTETAGTFSPIIQPWPNGVPHGLNTKYAIGLIQFEPDTATGLGTSTTQLAGMTAVEQLPYVQKYLQNVIDQYGPLNTTSDLYLAVFYPAALSQPATFQFPIDVQNENPLFFKGNAGTKQDFINWVANAIPDQYSALFTNVS